MSSKYLVVGSRSFIAQDWMAAAPQQVVGVPHDGLDSATARSVEVIVNCAVSPDFKRTAYREADDFDLRAARHAASLGKHFVMLSTRKVYRQNVQTIVLDEHSALDPSDHYGANKLESERRIMALLGERCTILRVANVYGYELGRRSFFGMAMTKLREEQRIILDVSPFAERDFIAVETLSDLLTRICTLKPVGIYNLGSGIGLPLGRIAQWLIQGYGRGKLEVVDINERDSFIMNIVKLRTTLGLPETPDNFELHIKNLGTRLTHE